MCSGSGLFQSVCHQLTINPLDRLDVLRGLISDVTNAAKTSNPVNTDSQILAIIRKRVKSSKAATDEFQTAKREDLRAREIAQIAMLEDYVKASESMGEADITTAIQDAIETMRTEEKEVNRGSVMKALVGPGGSLADQTVDKSEVSRLVGGMI